MSTCAIKIGTDDDTYPILNSYGRNKKEEEIN
jgi:hypothetical protein